MRGLSPQESGNGFLDWRKDMNEKMAMAEESAGQERILSFVAATVLSAEDLERVAGGLCKAPGRTTPGYGQWGDAGEDFDD